jgi:hypothetical protein
MRSFVNLRLVNRRSSVNRLRDRITVCYSRWALEGLVGVRESAPYSVTVGLLSTDDVNRLFLTFWPHAEACALAQLPTTVAVPFSISLMAADHPSSQCGNARAALDHSAEG